MKFIVELSTMVAAHIVLVIDAGDQAQAEFLACETIAAMNAVPQGEPPLPLPADKAWVIDTSDNMAWEVEGVDVAI